MIKKKKKKHCDVCGKKLVDGRCAWCRWEESSFEGLSETEDISHVKKNTGKMVWGAISIFLILLPMFLQTPPARMLVSAVQKQQVETAVPESAYANVSRELSAAGGEVSVTLSEGNYIVGIDIAEGVYKINTESRIAGIDLEDRENEINHYAHLNKDADHKAPYLEDYRLYTGAIVCIERGQITFSSSNGQVDKLQVLPLNEGGETYPVADGAVAGIDFPIGTYDITAMEGRYGSVNISYTDKNEDALGFRGVLGTDEGEIQTFRNVEFPKGTLIELSDVEIILEPSARNSLEKEGDV